MPLVLMNIRSIRNQHDSSWLAEVAIKTSLIFTKEMRCELIQIGYSYSLTIFFAQILDEENEAMEETRIFLS